MDKPERHNGTVMKRSPRFGNGTTRDEMKAENRVLARARRLGIAGDVEALQLALAAAIGVYDQILATVPISVRPLVEGAGGNSMRLAREILGVV